MIDDEIKIQAELRSLWRTLETGKIQKLTQLRTQTRIGDRFVGIATDVGKARHILIPCPAGNDADGLWRSSAVVLSRQTFVAGDVIGTWLVLSCLRHELDEVFLRLGASVVSSLPADPAAANASCLATLEKWRDLLGPVKLGLLTQEQIVGLLGELLVLEKLVEEDPRRALEAWEGPSGGRHDFRYGSHVIEAKASANRIGRFVTIHGPTQLEPPAAGILHLSWIRFERAPGGSLSLGSVIPRLHAKGIEKRHLRELLLKRAYDDSIVSPASEASFELDEWKIWLVDSTFPRIIPSTFVDGALPSSVINLQYTVDLSGSWPEPLDASRIEQVFSNMMTTT